MRLAVSASPVARAIMTIERVRRLVLMRPRPDRLPTMLAVIRAIPISRIALAIGMKTLSFVHRPVSLCCRVPPGAVD